MFYLILISKPIIDKVVSGIKIYDVVPEYLKYVVADHRLGYRFLREFTAKKYFSANFANNMYSTSLKI